MSGNYLVHDLPAKMALTALVEVFTPSAAKPLILIQFLWLFLESTFKNGLNELIKHKKFDKKYKNLFDFNVNLNQTHKTR